MFAGASGAAPAVRDGWEVTGATGLSLADGNADSGAYSLQLLATRITAIDEIYLSGDFFYADDNGVETTNSLRLGGQYNRLLNDRLSYGFNGSYPTKRAFSIRKPRTGAPLPSARPPTSTPTSPPTSPSAWPPPAPTTTPPPRAASGMTPRSPVALR